MIMIMQRKVERSSPTVSRMAVGRLRGVNPLSTRSILNYGTPLDAGKQGGRGAGGRVPASRGLSLTGVGLVGEEVTGQVDDQVLGGGASCPREGPSDINSEACGFPDPEIANANVDYQEEIEDHYYESSSFGRNRNEADGAGCSKNPEEAISLLESDDDVSFVSYSYAGMETSANFGASPAPSLIRSKKRRLGSPRNKEKDRLTIGQKLEIEDRKNMVKYLSVADAGNQIVEWLSEIENCRRKSSSLQDPVSKVMKINLWSAKEAVEDLIARKDSGKKEDLYNKQYQELKNEFNKMKEENRMLRQSIKSLTDKLSNRKSSIEEGQTRQSLYSAALKRRSDARGGTQLRRDVPRSSAFVARTAPEKETNISKEKRKNADRLNMVRKGKWEAANELLIRFTDTMKALLADDLGSVSGGEIGRSLGTRQDERESYVRSCLVPSLANNTPASSSEFGGGESEGWEMARRNKRKRLGDENARRKIQVTERNDDSGYERPQRVPRPRAKERNKPKVYSLNVAAISIVIEMYTTHELNLADQGHRNPRSRRGLGSSVPAPPVSSSDVGRNQELPTDSSVELTTVEEGGCPFRGPWRKPDALEIRILKPSKTEILRLRGGYDDPPLPPPTSEGTSSRPTTPRIGRRDKPGPPCAKEGRAGDKENDGSEKCRSRSYSTESNMSRVSTASVAGTKRRADGPIPGGDGRNNDENSDVDMEIEPAAGKSKLTSPWAEKKGRGRLAVNEANVGRFTAQAIAEKKREQELRREKKKEAEAILIIEDPTIRPTSSKKLSETEKEARKLKEFYDLESNAGLVNRTRETVEEVRKVAQNSGNLKGTFQGKLWKVTAKVLAATEILYKRNMGTEAGASEDVDGGRRILQQEILQLRRDNADLRSAVECLRAKLREVKSRKLTPTTGGTSVRKPG